MTQDTHDPTTQRIALVAHDHEKAALLDWARYNRALLQQHELYATGTTGALLEQELAVPVHKLRSGPLGGDQQIGARIAEDALDLLIFFWDPLQTHPHDPDVRALLRIAVLWNIPVACNRASADYLISSPLLDGVYHRRRPDPAGDRDRSIEGPTLASCDTTPVPLRCPRLHAASTVTRDHVAETEPLPYQEDT